MSTVEKAMGIDTGSGPWTGKKRIRAVLFLTAFALVGLPLRLQAQANAAAPGTAPEKVVLQLKWLHQFNFAGFYAAVEKGYYREAGLEVAIKEGRPGMDFIGEVVSGRANFGVEMPELLIARQNGAPVVVLAALFQHSPQILLARADSGIESPQHLVGKKVMWRQDSAAELQAMLANENVPLEQVVFMELSWDIDDLITGKVDAVHAYITDQPLALQKAGVAAKMLSPLTYGIDFYGDCLFTSEKELSEHPERAKAFREASLRGWAYAMDHPEEIMDVIRDIYRTKSSREYLRHEFEHINQLMLPRLVEIGHMNPGRWRHIGDTFVRLGMLDPDYSLQGFLYDPDPQPDYTTVKRTVGMLLGLMTLISVGSIVLVVFNRKLKNEVAERTKHLSAEIVERKRAEHEISVRKAEFEAIFNSISDAVVFIDTDRRLIMVNPAFTRLFGYRPEEIVGKTTEFMYADPEEFGEQEQQRHRLSAQITQPVYEIMYRRKDGSVFPAETLGAHVKSPGGETMGSIGVMRDITLRKQAEKEKSDLEGHLRQAYKMEAIGTMAGGIAHDFNNILTVILGFADLAKEGAPPDSKLSQDLDQVLIAGLRAKDLVQQLLAFSRKAERELVPTRLQGIVQETFRLLRSSIPATVEIIQDIEPDCGVVRADPTQINQIIMNLSTNAVHAMDEKGVLRVTLQEVDLDTEALRYRPGLAPGRFVQLSVADTGAGMDETTLARGFDPFFTTKEVGKGTGMGLAVVHGIVETHGGIITVDSEVGKGTTFRVFFPVVEQDEVAPVDDTSPLPTGSERILLVDDEPSIADLERSMLEHLGYHVVALTSSREALRAFRSGSEEFDLIITDQTMPEMSGTELSAELQKIRPEVPIILCTGYSSKITEEREAQALGIAGFMMKPMDRRRIAGIVRKVLDEKREKQ